MDLSQVLNGAPSPDAPLPPSPVPGMNMASMMQPTPDYIQQSQRPAANPQELEKRMQGWSAIQNRLESNPTLLHSLMAASAQMMGPVGPGGGAANIGRAFAAGGNAFVQGEEREKQNKLLMAREGRAVSAERREEALHPERVAALRASTSGTQAGADLTRARVPGAEAESAIRVATAQDAIRASEVSRKTAELVLEGKEGEEAVARLERDVRAIRAFAQRNTADVDVQRAADAADTALKQAKQNLEKTGHDLTLSRLTAESLQRMPQADLDKLVKAKFAGTAGTGSAIVRQMEAWGEIYDKLPPEDASKQGKTKEQYVSAQIRSGKAEDISKMRKNYIDSGGEDPEIIAEFDNLLKAVMRERGGAPAPGGNLKRVTSRVEYDRLKKGERYIDPQGQERTKQ